MHLTTQYLSFIRIHVHAFGRKRSRERKGGVKFVYKSNQATLNWMNWMKLNWIEGCFREIQINRKVYFISISPNKRLLIKLEAHVWSTQRTEIKPNKIPFQIGLPVLHLITVGWSNFSNYFCSIQCNQMKSEVCEIKFQLYLLQASCSSDQFRLIIITIVPCQEFCG